LFSAIKQLKTQTLRKEDAIMAYVGKREKEYGTPGQQYQIPTTCGNPNCGATYYIQSPGDDGYTRCPYCDWLGHRN
jgi:hypothetical protein